MYSTLACFLICIQLALTEHLLCIRHSAKHCQGVSIRHGPCSMAPAVVEGDAYVKLTTGDVSTTQQERK